jgi:hypothetical protein
MPDEPRPALTPEEWAGRKRPQYYGEQPCIQLWSSGAIDLSRDVQRDGEWAPGDRVSIDAGDTASAHALMALANAALPDGHPNKITRDDVQRVYVAQQDAAEKYPHAAEAGWLAPGLLALAAKLAALLPPEDPPRAP